MNYSPKPTDTTGITLPADLQGLVDKLACNVHEVWAERRMQEGWRAGPETDAERKIHSMLVPYEQLNPAEQAYDRLTVEQTLKPLLAMGYRIVPPPTAAAEGRPVDPAAAGRLFDLCQAEVAAKYQQADQAAIRQQRYHRRLAVAAATFGTAAALFALSQLAEPLRGIWSAVLEILFAAAALLSVILGLAGSRKDRWLVERHKAEQLVSIQFRALAGLLDNCGHAADDNGFCDCLRRQVAQVVGQDVRAVRQWMTREPPSGRPAHPDFWPVLSIRDLYLQHRLRPQIDYFTRMARSWHRRESWTARIAPVTFFASVACVFAHFVYELIRGGHPGLASLALVLLAAALPMAGAGVRTLRGAFEFGRNALRFETARAALVRLAAHLESTSDPVAATDCIWMSEQLLESEHRQWLHLMAESEWFA